MANDERDLEDSKGILHCPTNDAWVNLDTPRPHIDNSPQHLFQLYSSPEDYADVIPRLLQSVWSTRRQLNEHRSGPPCVQVRRS